MDICGCNCLWLFGFSWIMKFVARLLLALGFSVLVVMIVCCFDSLVMVLMFALGFIVLWRGCWFVG